MNSQVVGLIVSLRDQFTPHANRVRATVKNLGQDATRYGRQFRESFSFILEAFGLTDNASEQQQKNLRRLGLAFAATTLGLYTIRHAALSATDAFNAQFSSLMRLDNLAQRWGRNSANVRAMVGNLVAGGGFSTVQAAGDISALLGSRFNESQSQFLMNGLKNLAAFNRPAGMDFTQAISGAIQSIQSGSSAGLEALGIPNLDMRMRLMGSGMSDLNDPFRQFIGRSVLLRILGTEFARVNGQFEQFKQSLEGAQSQLRVQLVEARAMVGQALAPAVAFIVRQITILVKAVGDFAKQHPQLVRLGFALAIIGVIIPTLVAGFILLKGAIIALSIYAAPLVGVFALIGILAVGIQKNFLGMGDVAKRWWANVKLIATGVVELLSTMSGSTSSLSKKTHDALQNAGLLKFALNIGWVFWNVKEAVISLFKGIYTGLTPLLFVMRVVMWVIEKLGSVLAALGVQTGKILPLMWAMRLVGIAIGIVLTILAVKAVIAGVSMLVAFAPVLLVIIAIIGALMILKALWTDIKAIFTGRGGNGLIAGIVSGNPALAGAAVVNEFFGPKLDTAKPTSWLAKTPTAKAGGSMSDIINGAGGLSLSDSTIEKIADATSKRPTQLTVPVSLDGRKMSESQAWYDADNQLRAAGGSR